MTVSIISSKASPGAAVPWTTYEAENMLIGGGTIMGPQYNPVQIPTEASGRKCVQLSGMGQYIQFTNQSTANALVVRYCVPDTVNGGGADYTLGLYTNGVLAARLPVTSKYSWLYGNYPFTNNPAAGLARDFFDEVRTNGLSLSPGTVVRLQKDASDTAAFYVIDLVDVENVAPALSSPSNSVSVTTYGAVADGVTDCTTAFQNCINGTYNQGKSVWIPSGSYLITGTLNLPSNTQIYGAGMWYSRLVGSPTLYTSASRRVNLNGSGSNIKLSDFAIIGCLNYRNDSEGNDGLGGSYGTGSSIARLWIEHTKAAAWIFNSKGLVVDGCRFRDTLADGININYAMQNTIVTNCTTRGTGDDCFAMWPAPASGNYTPGNNVVTHCTGQLPFLANGGAIYGGANNRIEDSLFSDLPYGCGILFSTTFQVAFTFSGTNVAQRCDVVRCGGYDGGYGWRSAVQIVMDNYNGISGIIFSNLNVVDSISSGLSIIGAAGPLTNAVAMGVNIPDYNLNNIAGQHAWWAECDNGCPSGSLTVSNSVVPDVQNDSGTFTFNFISNQVMATMTCGPGGSVSPGNLWTNIGAVINISATPSNGYAFSNWSGTGSGSYSGPSNLASIVVNGPVAENATFLPPMRPITGMSFNTSNGVSLTFGTQPGFVYHVEATTNLAPPSWSPVSGSATNAANNSVTVHDPDPVTNAQRFYRAVSP